MAWIHFLFIYYFSYFLISTVGLSMLWLLNLNFSNVVLRQFNPLYIAISGYSLVTCLLVYFEGSGVVSFSVFNSLVLLKVILTYAFQVYIALFLHEILPVSGVKRMNRFVIGSAIVCGFFSIIFITGTDFWTSVRSMNDLPFSLMVFTGCLNVYLISMVGKMFIKKVVLDEQSKRILKQVFLLAILSLPGFYFDIFQGKVLELFPSFPGGFTYSVMFFSIINIYFIYVSYKWITQKSIKEAGSVRDISLSFNNLFKLSPREMEVFNLLNEGKRNKEIGEILFISESTVKKHIKNMFEKTETKNRHELVRKVSLFGAAE